MEKSGTNNSTSSLRKVCWREDWVSKSLKKYMSATFQITCTRTSNQKWPKLSTNTVFLTQLWPLLSHQHYQISLAIQQKRRIKKQQGWFACRRGWSWWRQTWRRSRQSRGGERQRIYKHRTTSYYCYLHPYCQQTCGQSFFAWSHQQYWSRHKEQEQDYQRHGFHNTLPCVWLQE